MHRLITTWGRSVAIFAIRLLTCRILYVECVGIFMIYLNTKLHIPGPSSPLVNVMKLKTKCGLRTVAIVIN